MINLRYSPVAPDDRVAKSRVRDESPAAQLLSSRLVCGIRAYPLRTSWVPTGDEACIGALGLLHPAALFFPVALYVVGVPSLLAAHSLAPGLEFHIAQASWHAGRVEPTRNSRPSQQMTDHDREFACGCHGRDMLSAPGSHAAGRRLATAAQAASTSMPRARPCLVIRPW